MSAAPKWTILGDHGATAPRVGATYSINHSRKGKFRGRVLSVDDIWCTVEIVEGRANAMLDYNIRDVGEQVTCRDSLTTWTLDGAA